MFLALAANTGLIDRKLHGEKRWLFLWSPAVARANLVVKILNTRLLEIVLNI